MAKLYANPYGYGGVGFYFDDAEEFHKKFKEHLHKGSDPPYEEYEIDFIDGDDFEHTIFDALKVSQGDVDRYFELLDELDPDSAPALYVLTEQLGYSFEPALEKLEDAYVYEGTAKDYAYEYVDEVGWEGVGDNMIEGNFDYDSFGRDVRIEGGIDPANDEDQYPVQEEPERDDFDDEYDFDEAVEQYAEFVEAEKKYDRMTDQEIGEYVVYDIYGGTDQLAPETLQNYFDYEAFARDLTLNGDWAEFRYDGDDYVLVNALAL